LALAARIHGAGDAELIREVLDALSVPAGPDDSRPVGTRRADALLELFTQAAAPTGIAEPEPAPDAAPDPQPEPVTEEPVTEDVGPVSTPGRPLLTVTIDHEWLRLQVGHGLLDSDAAISPGEARRLACDAGIVPMVLGSRSQPLDVGRLSYTIPDGMRRAVHARDRGCTFPGCTRRPRRCQVHHARHWIDGGPTQLDNLSTKRIALRITCTTHVCTTVSGNTAVIASGSPESPSQRSSRRPWPTAAGPRAAAATIAGATTPTGGGGSRPGSLRTG